MIDYEQIGKRIQEERKYLRHISQEKMAEDLGMYQADISNLEKAKNGSGITDLSKLDMIADYFDVPLEVLLFGRRQGQMEKYSGSKMQLKESAGKLSKRQETILNRLLGIESDTQAEDYKKGVPFYECGPYKVFVPTEIQCALIGKESSQNFLQKIHLYVMYQDEVIGSATAAVTVMMQHIYEPAFKSLKNFILPDTFDLDETQYVLNPYMLLYKLPMNEEEQTSSRKRMLARMDELRDAGGDRTIYYVENAYVREDCRRNGIFRLMIDVLKMKAPSSLIWLSLEPTSGDELSTEYGYHPTYQASELGQINLNASIAEHLGFTIDGITVERQAERVEEDGSVIIETVPVRRTAYYMPKKIRSILNTDGSMLATARARLRMAEGLMEKPRVVDIYQGAWKKHGFIMSIKMDYKDETVYTFARGKTWSTRWLGVSKANPALDGEEVETIEKYSGLKDAETSKYYLGLRVAEQLLGTIFFGTVKPEDVQMDLLQ